MTGSITEAILFRFLRKPSGLWVVIADFTVSIHQIMIAQPNVSVGMEVAPWQTINDGVMGGLSAGVLMSTDHGLRFQGHLSLENNGGFTSVRRLFSGELKDACGVRLRIRGDGHRFQFLVRMNDCPDGRVWRAMIETDGSWQDVKLFFKNFVAAFRGKPIPDEAPMNPRGITGIGFLISDRQEGRFEIDIAAIEFFCQS